MNQKTAPLFAPPQPLAARMRPRTLKDFIGQQHLVGEGKVLWRSLKAGRLFSSMIFWGPPGTGKTTLAKVMARVLDCRFFTLSAVMAGVADIRKVVEEARKEHVQGRRTVVLIDEIHRFNKAQQDALLPHVEEGLITLIGATTENPYFEIIGPLLSRARVFIFEPLAEEEILTLLRRALADKEQGLGATPAEVSEEALRHFARLSGGDARRALSALELAVLSTEPGADGRIRVDLEVARECMPRRDLIYDKEGDAHYDTLSSFIKSVRGSDVDAALYWLARLLEGGEDPRLILRRLFVLASEDIGLADPQALVQVAAASQALTWVGLPEAQFHLAQATIYLALAPKSNSTLAFFKAKEALKEKGATRVPAPLQDAHRDGRALGHGEGYLYPHDFPGHFVEQDYLPPEVKGERFYEPGTEGEEPRLAARGRARREPSPKDPGDGQED